MTKDPNRPDDMDSEGKAVPPYEGRRKSADTSGKEKSSRGGARTGGATGPVEDDEMKAADPEKTARGATASPSDERPARRSRNSGGDEGTGPAHKRGTRRAEDQS
ncbi:hypothetical protein [Streptomyces sp. NPDC088725]|uniref:hypothetical protein n=1 Tax=Streptomyces sp. NPDC088725 TaxID=3365873 RepID=UPI00380A52E6